MKFIPNVRYHGCPQCRSVWECDACTAAVLASQELGRRHKVADREWTRLDAPEHNGWRRRDSLCPSCLNHKKLFGKGKSQ